MFSASCPSFFSDSRTFFTGVAILRGKRDVDITLANVFDIPFIVMGSAPHHLPSSPSKLKIQISRLSRRMMIPGHCPTDQNAVFNLFWRRIKSKPPAKTFPAESVCTGFLFMTRDTLKHHHLE